MALSVLRLHYVVCSLLVITSIYAGELDKLLSSLKLETLQLKLNQNSNESKKLEYSWINPIIVNYGHTTTDQFGKTLTNRSLSVSVDQPIFKSGGIWYAIKYAKATKRVGELGVELQKRALIKQVISTLFNLKKIEYQIQKQKLLIENDRIDIERKKEQFLSGELDSSFLDQAILKKNQDMINLYTLQDTKAKLKSNFKNLSDLEPNSVNLPRFKLIKRDDYIKNNIHLALTKEQIVQKDYFNTMTWARYMPSISLQASYVKPYEFGSVFVAPSLNVLNSYHTYGFRISLPIEISSYHNIQSTKADYLKAKIELLDKKREAQNEYSSILERLRIVDNKLKLAIDDEKLYTSLVESTKEKVKIGEMTLYDLKTLENSKMIRQIDQKIFDLDKQLILLDLYEKSYKDIK